MEIFRQPDAKSAAAEAGEHLNAFLLANKKSPILLTLSGGSALSILEYVGPAALGENLAISVLDERFSIEPEVNNFLQLQKTDFYKDAFETEASFFGTLPRDGEGPEDLRQRWDKNLKNWREENPNGLIVATLGMGQDGHTAGIFPFPEDADKFQSMFCGGSWTAAYNAGNKSQYTERITTTVTFLKMVDFGFAFVVGKEKQEIFTRLTSGNVKTVGIPAAVWREIKNLKIFTDLK